MISEELFQPTFELSRWALARVGVEMDDGALTLCIMSLVGQIIHALKAAHFSLPGDHQTMIPDLHSHIRHIVRFSVAGFLACASNTEQS